jgi:Glycosyl hydrolase family 12
MARAAIGAAVTALLLAAGQPASAGPRPSADLMLCGHLQHIVVTDSRQQANIIKNDNFGGTAECLLNKNQGTNYQVVSSAAASKTNAVMAFPEIYTGCSWGICSPGTTLPLPLSEAGQPEVSWDTVQRAPGRWDAALDIWFNPVPIMTGQATGAEMMIWLNAQRYPVPRHTRKVWVDGQQWYLQRWTARHHGTHWHYIQFRRVHPTWRVDQLRLMPFIHLAESVRWIKPEWWLLNIEAGFEIWQGGTGLATRSFRAQP